VSGETTKTLNQLIVMMRKVMQLTIHNMILNHLMLILRLAWEWRQLLIISIRMERSLIKRAKRQVNKDKKTWTYAIFWDF